MGRPTKLDDLRAKRIVDAVAEGASRTVAAAKGGIDRSTLLGWLARGRDGEAPYDDFLLRVKKAEAEAEEAMVVCVRMAAMNPKNWTAAAWWLERCRPLDYAKREPTREEESGRAEAEADEDLPMLESLLAAAKSKVGT